MGQTDGNGRRGGPCNTPFHCVYRIVYLNTLHSRAVCHLPKGAYACRTLLCAVKLLLIKYEHVLNGTLSWRYWWRSSGILKRSISLCVVRGFYVIPENFEWTPPPCCVFVDRHLFSSFGRRPNESTVFNFVLSFDMYIRSLVRPLRDRQKTRNNWPFHDDNLYLEVLDPNERLALIPFRSVWLV